MSLLDRLVQRTGKPPSPNSRIAGIVWRKGVSHTSELDRILALPRRVLDLDNVPDLTPLYLHTPVCGVAGCDLCARGPARLLPMQSAMLLEAERTRGALGALPVGEGKSLTSMLLVDALALMRAIILVPPDVRDQLVEVDIPRYGRHFRLPLGRFTVVSYSQLSNASTADVLEEIDPDGIIPDEAHLLRHRSSARTKRFYRCVRARPGIPVVPLSGSFTVRSVHDYAAISEVALRKGSPVPGNWKEQDDWALAIDEPKKGQESMPPGALMTFCSPEDLAEVEAKRKTPADAMRAGFRRRLVETPGVVATPRARLGTSLVLRARSITVPDVVTATIRQLERTWSIGDEEIDSAATMAAKAREMSCGFYYVWDWPGGVVDKEWIDARRTWNRAVRQFLAHRARPGLDSPLLLTNAVMRGKVPDLEPAWKAWDAVRDRPQPPTKPVWISDFLVKDALAWMHDAEGSNGILWYAHTAFGNALAASGSYPVFGAGTSEELICLCDAAEAPPVIACSVHSHRKGKNMQHHWSRSYFTSPMANGEAWEQALGRTHRNGQRADEVTAEVAVHTHACRAAWDQARVDARSIEDRSMQGPQKLCYATRLGL